MIRNSLLALVTLIALLWINGGDCQKEAQNENEVDIAKRQKGLSITNIKMKPVLVDETECPANFNCETLKTCIERCPPRTDVMRNPNAKYDGDCLEKCTGLAPGFETIYCEDKCGKGRAEAEMADEDEADEAKSDEVDIAKRQKGLKILKAWKRDEAEMAAVDEADEDKAQN